MVTTALLIWLAIVALVLVFGYRWRSLRDQKDQELRDVRQRVKASILADLDRQQRRARRKGGNDAA